MLKSSFKKHSEAFCKWSVNNEQATSNTSQLGFKPQPHLLASSFVFFHIWLGVVSEMT